MNCPHIQGSVPPCVCPPLMDISHLLEPTMILIKKKKYISSYRYKPYPDFIPK
jgi:hypothetical protein